jgi:pilus assembly protein TadC
MKESPFFAKQRIDAVGNSAVALQKVLIALWILIIFSVFLTPGFGILGILFYSFLIFCGFYGAVKRSQGWLNFFWIVELICLIINSIVLVLQVIFVTTFIARYAYFFSRFLFFCFFACFSQKFPIHTPRN